ncbi:MAG: hypothetical protein HY321_16490 [Armatimonadetes bacterium]|nr:hypothetical protein [Armatimonadota bacterium]
MKHRAILCVQLEHFCARGAALRAGEALAGRQAAVTRGGRVLDSSPEAAVAFVPAADEDYPDDARPGLDLCAAFTPLVEPETPERIFLDVTGCEALQGPAMAVAGVLARRIPAETGFACAVGGGRTRLVAALAAPWRRWVPPGEEREFLAPLSLRLLGERLDVEMARWLELRGVATFEDVARLPAGVLRRRFGAEGEKLARLAAGLDSTPVRPAHPPRALEACVECEAPAETEQEMAQYLSHLACEVADRLRETRETARRFRLDLFFRDGRREAVALRLSAPIGARTAIYDALLRLFRKLAPAEPPCGAAAAAEEIAPREPF